MSRPAGAARRVEARRMVYYRRDPDAAFWDDHWREQAGVDPYASAHRGFLGPLERPILKHLPRAGKILEAGCGPGQHVVALRQRGYDVEGIDWAPETVASATARHPGLPITVGNVAHLPVPADHYAGYLSFGVVEHSREGPEALLREAHRVVRPGGIALVSVPSFHGLRRLKSRLGAYREEPSESAFYQYAFTGDEFCGFVRDSGFGIVRVYGYDAYKGITDEVRWLRYLLDRQLVRYHLGALAQRALRHLPWIEGPFGHMLLVVARKPDR